MYVKTYEVDVNTSRAPEEGGHSPSWPNGLLIIFMLVSVQGRYRVGVGGTVIKIERLLAGASKATQLSAFTFTLLGTIGTNNHIMFINCKQY
jgi:hypothetical protein